MKVLVKQMFISLNNLLKVSFKFISLNFWNLFCRLSNKLNFLHVEINISITAIQL